MKVAIVHDYLIKLGGAERVLEVIHKMFPDAPVYTFIFDAEKTQHKYDKWDIRPSYLQKMPWSKKKIDFYRPLMPAAIEQFDFSGFDLVISNNHSFAKGIITKPETVHVCYCHTPTRYLWHQVNIANNKLGWLTRKIAPYVLNYLRVFDYLSAQRVDYFMANSKAVKDRIKKYYRRDSDILYPPVDISRFNISKETEDYFLIVSRLEPHKSVDLAISAFNDLGIPLKIIGAGSEYENLKSMAKKNIEFLGEISDEEVERYISKCKAFIFPQEEDFGITALEAQACGRPVVAFRKGGALETVVDGKTGVFFDEQTAPCLAEAIRNFDNIKFDVQEIRNQAEKFSEENFMKNLSNLIDKYCYKK